MVVLYLNLCYSEGCYNEVDQYMYDAANNIVSVWQKSCQQPCILTVRN